jgi:hypothetical protein
MAAVNDSKDEQMSIDQIRNTLVKATNKGPSSGPDYVEMLNRTRRWMLDLAETMVPVYIECIGQGMDPDSGFVGNAIALARAEAELPYEEYAAGMPKLREAISQISSSVREAFHYEEVAEYSSAYSASRAALQAIHTAISAPDDFDIFSLSSKAALLAEQCCLAHAYRTISRNTDSAPASTGQVAAVLVAARAHFGSSYANALHSRVSENAVRMLYVDERAAPSMA